MVDDSVLSVDLNADGGESFGRWAMGADEELAPFITSINVACGWHAGDAATMVRSIKLARRHDLGLGAHPGLPDLVGFGRRAMALSPLEAAQAVIYQTGALRGLADQHGVPLRHVKPHGSLYGMLIKDDAIADAVCDAVGEMDAGLSLFLEAGSCAERQRERGHRVVSEGFGDLEYSDEGHIIIDPDNQRRDPTWCADQVGRMLGGVLRSANGVEKPVKVESICLHSDRPGAVDNARAVVDRIREAGWTVRAVHAQEQEQP